MGGYNVNEFEISCYNNAAEPWIRFPLPIYIHCFHGYYSELIGNPGGERRD